MSRTQRRERIDLFDDPSWDSPKSREEAAAYARIAVSGFSATTESVVLVFSLSLWILGVVAMALLFASFMGLFSFNPAGW